MTQSALSIVVPAYNVLSYLERCVGSLLESTVQDIDVIVVDDGSTDGTGRLCDDLARSDPRVSVVHQPNGGLSAARNTGLTAAQGRYVMFLDADDWAEPTMAAEMIAAADASGAEVVMAGCVVDFEDDKGGLQSTETRLVPGQVLGPGRGALLFSDQLLGLLGYAWNKLYRRDFLLEHDLWFAEGLSLVEDIDFNGRVFLRAGVVALVEAAHVHYVQRPRVSLGTRHYPDFLALRLQAIADLDAILGYWGMPADEREARMRLLRVQAARAMVRRMLDNDELSVSEKVADLRSQRRTAGGEFAGVSGWFGSVPLGEALYGWLFMNFPSAGILLAEGLRKRAQTFWRGARRTLP